jgi:putative membrane protein
MRFLIAVPVLLLLVLFALSNKQVVQLGLWPTDISVDAPVSVAVLVASAVFFVAGALMTWGGTLALRSRARRAEMAVTQLQAQLRAVKTRPAPAPPIMPARTALPMATMPSTTPSLAAPRV